MLEFILKMFFLCLGVIGTWLLYGEYIIEYFLNIKRRRRVNLKFSDTSDEDSSLIDYNNHPFLSKAKSIVELAHRNRISFDSYVAMLVLMFVFLMMFLYRTGNLSLNNILFSSLILLVPVAFTVTKFYFSRLESSYEGERLVVEFINQYRVNDGNILETINSTADSLKEEAHSRIALNRLYFDLNNARNDQEREAALYNFAYSINTQWATLLSHSILSAIVLGVDISESLEDILDEIKEIRNSIEKSKRDNNEGFSIVVILAPLSYVVTTYYAMSAVGMSFRTYLTNQFTNPLSYKLAILIIVTYVACLIFRKFLKKPKFD